MWRPLQRCRVVVIRRGRCPRRPAKSLPLTREVAPPQAVTKGGGRYGEVGTSPPSVSPYGSTAPPQGGAKRRPHGAGPTNPNGRGRWAETPHPSWPSAVPPSPEGEGWSGAPHAKRLPPSRGKLSSEARLMRVPTGVMRLTSAPSSGPSGHLPPCGGEGKGRRVQEAAPTMYLVCPSCRGGPMCPPRAPL